MDNTLWANTAVASGSALGVVVYTGQETRSLMNHSAPRSKIGLLDQEINQLTKVCRKAASTNFFSSFVADFKDRH